MKYILPVLILLGAVAAQAPACEKQRAAVPACGRKCVQEAAATLGCKPDDIKCQCAKSADYMQTVSTCLLLPDCIQQALATQSSTQEVCACVTGEKKAGGKKFKA